MQTKPRVLFVDDEERIVNLLRRMFRRDSEVHVATSGAQALEIVADHPIACWSQKLASAVTAPVSS